MKCPKCEKEIPMSGSVAIAVGRYWTVSNHYFCECGMKGEYWVGHGRMHGKDRMVWSKEGKK